MKYYIVGYTEVEFLVEGVLLPKKVYSSEEKARGKKEITEVGDVVLAQLRANKVFIALETAKKIRVLDKLPGWAVSGADREAALKERIKELESKKGNSQDKQKIKDLEAEKESITAEAQKVIDALRAENAQLKAATEKA